MIHAMSQACWHVGERKIDECRRRYRVSLSGSGEAAYSCIWLKYRGTNVMEFQIGVWSGGADLVCFVFAKIESPPSFLKL